MRFNKCWEKLQWATIQYRKKNQTSVEGRNFYENTAQEIKHFLTRTKKNHPLENSLNRKSLYSFIFYFIAMQASKRLLQMLGANSLIKKLKNYYPIMLLYVVCMMMVKYVCIYFILLHTSGWNEKLWKTMEDFFQSVKAKFSLCKQN